MLRIEPLPIERQWGIKARTKKTQKKNPILPIEMVIHILSFMPDPPIKPRLCIGYNDGKIIFTNQIRKNDYRYLMMERIERIQQSHNNRCSKVILYIENRNEKKGYCIMYLKGQRTSKIVDYYSNGQWVRLGFC